MRREGSDQTWRGFKREIGMNYTCELEAREVSRGIAELAL